MTGRMAPVAVFGFRRPEHLRRTLLALKECPGFDASPVVVYCDGPRNDEQRNDVEAVRRTAREVLGGQAEYRFSETNKGLSASIIGGATELVGRHGRVIVVEDDLRVDPQFIRYMNAGLERFADHDRVYQVSGYQYRVPQFRARPTALFLPMIVSWGWATWRRAWDHFDPFATGWERLRSDGRLRQAFNLGGVYDYATMLCRQMQGLGDSWAIRWYWSVFMKKGMTLFPPESLVRNTGFDGSGTHGRGLLRSFAAAANAPCVPRTADIAMPSGARVDPADFATVRDAIWGMNGRWLGAAVDRVRWYRSAWR